MGFPGHRYRRPTRRAHRCGRRAEPGEGLGRNLNSAVPNLIALSKGHVDREDVKVDSCDEIFLVNLPAGSGGVEVVGHVADAAVVAAVSILGVDQAEGSVGRRPLLATELEVLLRGGAGGNDEGNDEGCVSVDDSKRSHCCDAMVCGPQMRGVCEQKTMEVCS